MRRIAVHFSLIALGISTAYLASCAEEANSPAARIEVTPADAQTESIVAAAEAFLATLSNRQRNAVQFEWTDNEQRQNWSNFPSGMYQRAGVRWADLDEAQRTALMELLGAVLSPEGVEMVRHQMQADDVLLSQPQQGPAGPPPGGAQDGPPLGAPDRGPLGSGPPGGQQFGADEYFVSFVGTPSLTRPWMLQFGGHHLAINATVAGGSVTLSPTLTGGQPLQFTGSDGETVHLTRDEIDAAHALLGSLSAEQREQAVVGDEVIDLVLGPQQDDAAIEAEGIAASELDEGQQERLIALILARLDMLNEDDRTPLMLQLRAGLPQTTFGWWGPTERGRPAYWRIVGPTLAIEYSPQAMGNDDGGNHAHNMYRNPANDYGASWVRSD